MRDANATHEVRVEGVQVTIVRKRVKNVNFRVASDGSVRMSVPLGMSWAQAEELARSRASWFVEHVAKVSTQNAYASGRLESGESVPLWGRPVQLRIEEGEGPRRYEATEQGVVLHTLRGDDERTRAAMLDAWYKAQIAERLRQIQPQCEARVGKRATSITLRRMTTRWGSCTASSGRIRLNVALAEFAPECLEMVLVHELCHLVVPNHGPQFYALMDLHCPGWRAAKRMLDARMPCD